MAWTNTDPGQGDPAAVSAIAASRRDKADDLRDTARSLRVLAHDGQTADWRGRAKEPFQANVGAFTTDVGTLAVALDEQDPILAGHGPAERPDLPVELIAEDPDGAHHALLLPIDGARQHSPTLPP